MKRDTLKNPQIRAKMDPRVISLDIETYGAAKANHQGKSLPPQTVFHPKKSLYIDGVSPEDLILTVAVTLPIEDPRKSIDEPWDVAKLGQLHPGSTMVLNMWNKMHRECLANWLQHADTILGMNIQFDLLYLREFDPVFRSLIGKTSTEPTHTLIDLSVLNYLHSELREERSLKALGPILGSFSYDETLKNSRFNTSGEERLKLYNAQDTHNTMLAISEFGKRIRKEFKLTDKGGPWSLKFYSRNIWTAIYMSESGIPMSSLMLEDLYEDMKTKMEQACLNAKKYGLILQGEGSAVSKDQLIDACINLIEETNEDILDELEVTAKKKKVSFTKGNRVTLLENLPDSALKLRKCLDYANEHSEAQKILSSYCYPLLHHRRNKIDDKSSIIIPKDSKPLKSFKKKPAKIYATTSERIDACQTKDEPVTYKNRFRGDRTSSQGDSFAYPTWYITPSHIKENKGSSGGTIQGRITCKGPSAQTFPPTVKNCLRSRFDEGVILGMDLSQIELRVAALLSGESSMIKAYKQGLDLHADRARSLWSDYDRLQTSQKSRRQVGKMMNFADLFLSSADTMKEQVYTQSGGSIDLPIEFFKKVVRSRATVRSKLTDWQLSLLQKAKNDRAIILPFTGQSRTFIGNLGKSRSEIVNFPVQTTAGNLTLCIQQELNDLVESVWFDVVNKPMIFMQIYDAIYIDTPLDCLETVKGLIETAITLVTGTKGYWGMLEEYTGNSIPLDYDIEILS